MLHNRIRRFVCSDPWRWQVYESIFHCRIKYKPQQSSQEQAVRASGIYPPGGLLTKMVKCKTCRRWIPPQAVGNSGECIECYYEEMELEQMVQLPSARRYSWPVKDAALPAHLEGSGYEKRMSHAVFKCEDGERIRERRFLVLTGRGESIVREETMGEDGFIYERDILPDEPGQVVEIPA